MNDIININKLSTNAKIELCNQIEKKSHYSGVKLAAWYLKKRLISKIIKDEKTKNQSTKGA
jgi:hypothetical protein